MANLQGYGTGSVGNMLNHYTRHAGDPEQTRYRYANQDIDPARTHLNYAIFAREDPAAFVQSKIDGADVKPKGGDKATNVISDWVITLPKNPALKGREREFFQTAYDHMLKTVPERLVVGAWVHMDENQPHMHFCFCPMVRTAVMTNDKSRPLLDAQGRVKRDKKGTPRYERVQVRDAAGKPVYRSSFGQSKVYTRARMKRFHPDLEKAMEGHFGFKVGIELEDKGEKLLSDLKQPDYIKAKETMARQQRRIRALEAMEVETRGKLGALTDEVEEKRSQAADIGLKVDEKTIELDGLRDEIEQKALDLAAAKAECEAVSQRLESLRQREREIAGDVAELRPIAAEIGRWEAADRAGKRAILDSIAVGCGALRERIQGRVERLGKRIEEVGARVRALREKVMPSTRKLKRGLKEKQESLDEMMDWARKSAGSFGRESAPTRSRPQSR